MAAWMVQFQCKLFSLQNTSYFHSGLLEDYHVLISLRKRKRVLQMLAIRRACRPRIFYDRMSLPQPNETSWQHMWDYGTERAFLSMLGFTREVFLEIHVPFKLLIDEERANVLSAPGGRPTLLDSKGLLAVGLYYLVNRCQQKGRFFCAIWLTH